MLYFTNNGMFAPLLCTILFCAVVKGELIWKTELTKKRTAGLARADNKSLYS